MRCPKQTRRSLLLTTLATGAFLTGGRFAAAQEDQPGSSDRPKKGDLLVVSEGERVGAVIAPGDVKLGEPPLHAWPKDPKTSVVRNGSRLNEIVLISQQDRNRFFTLPKKQSEVNQGGCRL